MAKKKGVDVQRKMSTKRVDHSEEIQDIAHAPPSKVFQRAVVVEVLNDVSLRSAEEIETLSQNTVDPASLKYAPRNSLIVRLYASGADKSGTKDLLCYPFFPPHFAMPIKQGEQVWVFAESPDVPQKVAYWIARIPEADFVDDINYTHGDRKFSIAVDKTEELSDLEEEPEDEDPPPEDADPPPEITGNKEPDTLPGPPAFNNGATEQGDDAATTLSQPQKEGAPEGEAEEGDPIYEVIFTGSLGGQAFALEPVPRFTKRPGDLVLQGSHNSLICLGTDRGWTVESRPDGADFSNAFTPDGEGLRPFSGTVDIVAGRGMFAGDLDPDKAELVDTEPRVIENARGALEVDKNPASYFGDDIRKDIELNRQDVAVEGDPDFVYDASRVYVSMNTDGDTNLDLASHTPEFVKEAGAEPIDESPYVIVKSNEIRIVSRHTKEENNREKVEGSIRIVREDEDPTKACTITMLPGGKVLIDAEQIVIGDGRENQTFVGNGATEQMVLGNTLTDSVLLPFLQAIRDNAPTISQGASPNVLAPAVLQATIQVLAALGDGGDENTILSKVGKIK
tara:strand:- start:178 stop:1872 length:1695 start_codon:yes stop_codon:yes gene_type:complete